MSFATVIARGKVVSQGGFHTSGVFGAFGAAVLTCNTNASAP
jgi:hypothetical protein